MLIMCMEEELYDKRPTINEESARQYLTAEKGFSAEQVAGAIANMKMEAGFGPHTRTTTPEEFIKALCDVTATVIVHTGSFFAIQDLIETHSIPLLYVFDEGTADKTQAVIAEAHAVGSALACVGSIAVNTRPQGRWASYVVADGVHAWMVLAAASTMRLISRKLRGQAGVA